MKPVFAGYSSYKQSHSHKQLFFFALFVTSAAVMSFSFVLYSLYQYILILVHLVTD